MRVLFTVLSVFSCGLLLWVPLLRLAIVRRRTVDWWLAGAGFALVCVLLPFPTDDARNGGGDYVSTVLMVLAMLAALTHYLVADTRHYAQLMRENATGGPVPPTPGHAYAPTVPVPEPVQSPGQPHAPQPYPPQQYQQPRSTPPTHQPQPPAQHPSAAPRPQRIDQVRAELDELSDYLRKEEGR
ncbi:hypothetical protein ACIBKZ_15035 [Streptomyces sp. NPDC050421]|uniref:hypothetical protein n=1 Tax=unclassified Streptomyces TaxID=2593676 RepID=UPI00379F7DBF